MPAAVSCHPFQSDPHICIALPNSLLCFCRYFIFADTCLITQYIYFQTLQHRRERLAAIPRQRLSPDDPLYRHAVRRPASVDEVHSLMQCIVEG